MWQKIKTFFLGLLKKIKAWAVNTVWPWFINHWMEVINIFVIWVAYVSTKGFLHRFIGIWLLIMVLYFIVWKFFGIEKIFKTVPPINPPTPPIPTNVNK